MEVWEEKVLEGDGKEMKGVTWRERRWEGGRVRVEERKMENKSRRVKNKKERKKGRQETGESEEDKEAVGKKGEKGERLTFHMCQTINHLLPTKPSYSCWRHVFIFSPVCRQTSGDVSCSRPKTEQACVLLQLRSEGTFRLCKSHAVCVHLVLLPFCLIPRPPLHHSRPLFGGGVWEWHYFLSHCVLRNTHEFPFPFQVVISIQHCHT